MKSKLLTLLSILLVVCAFSQKIDLGFTKTDIEYTALPARANLFSLATYDIEFVTSGTTLSQLRYNPKRVSEYLNLEGYGYVKKDGDFTLLVKIGEVKTVSEKLNSKQETINNPDGTKTTKTYYQAVVKLEIPTVIQIIDNKLEYTVYSREFSNSEKPTVFKSPELTEKSKVQQYIDYKEKEVNVHARNLYQKRFANEINKLKKLYEFKKAISSQKFITINENKAPSLKFINEDVLKVTTLLAQGKYDKDFDPIKSELTPIAESWTQKMNGVTGESKYDKKLKYVYSFNLAALNFWLENIDESIKNCRQFITNGYKPKNIEELHSEAKSVKKRFESLQLYTRHFHRRGFQEKGVYVFDKNSVTPPKRYNIIAQTRRDVNDLAQIGKDLKADYKEDFGNRELGDTISYQDAYFSSITYTIDGEEFTRTKRKLRKASATTRKEVQKRKDGFSIDIDAERAIIKAGKEGKQFGFFGMKFTPNYDISESFNADSIIKELKLNSGKTFTDMTPDSIAYYRNRKPYFDPTPSWDGFEDKWAVDFDFSYSQTTYKSVPQSKISYTIEKVEPIIVNTSYYGKKHEQGYFVTLKVPNITVGRIITPAWNQCFSPYRVNKTLEVENITLKVLVY